MQGHASQLFCLRVSLHWRLMLLPCISLPHSLTSQAWSWWLTWLPSAPVTCPWWWMYSAFPSSPLKALSPTECCLLSLLPVCFSILCPMYTLHLSVVLQCKAIRLLLLWNGSLQHAKVSGHISGALCCPHPPAFLISVRHLTPSLQKLSPALLLLPCPPNLLVLLSKCLLTLLC